MGISAITANNNLVSVVVPIYNVEKTLDDCLTSIEAQTHPTLEILCINDGSTDGSLEIVRSHARYDERYVVVDKPNEGYGASCNRGIGMARGVWVAIVEPDDLLEPNCFSDLLSCAESFGGATDVDVVRSAYWRSFPAQNGRETRVSCPYHKRVHPKKQPFAIGDGIELLYHHPSIWAGMYRRDYLLKKQIRFIEAPGSGWTDNPFLIETLCRTKRIVYTDARGYIYHERNLNEAETFAQNHPLVPLTRWNDMLDAAALAGVDDPRVLEALAVRGINYALITKKATGVATQEVRELIENSLARLDEDLVMQSSRISLAGKQLFAEARGLPEPHGHDMKHYLYLAQEAVGRIRANGLGFTLKTVFSRAKGGRV